eukprot:TRINITY_DN8043_c0_g1_i2.p1 TRINITY_DN8043_c0_g1~~TRINITY_DN8043_c0_g1_i2.p1  ORF type:complete len:570 (+),score=103.47 TRINITY_DN8043_c0_g1_i2:59-1768(+)
MQVSKYVEGVTFKAIYTVSRTSSVLYFFVGLGVYISSILIGYAQDPKPRHHHDLEPSWMLVYLYTLSIIYLTSLLLYFSGETHSRHCTHSHGSAFVRQGAFIFGLGAVIYTILDFLTTVLSSRVQDSLCHSPVNTFNAVLLLIFIILQMVVVIFHPRLNLRFEHGLSQLGLMHLILTNAIMWIRTIIKESMLEFYEVMEMESKDVDQLKEALQKNFTIEHLQDISRSVTKSGGYLCYEDLEDNFPTMYNFLQNWTPTLFPFIIEFSLIGCTLFFSMWNYVHLDKDVSIRRYAVNPREFLRSLDFTHSWMGFSLGALLVSLNFINLILFFKYSSLEDSTDEFISKSSNSAVNFCGSVASVMAILKIQQLKDKENVVGRGMDAALLYISGSFLILYSILEILVGANYKSNFTGYSRLQIVNGVFSVTSTIVQVIFINLTFVKGHEEKDDEREKKEIDYPARQETVFLALTNLSQWLIFTFEIQKTKSSRTEAEYFGPFHWVILERIIMPLSIFFRFHSTVVLVDSWKSNYPNNKRRQQLNPCPADISNSEDGPQAEAMEMENAIVRSSGEP